MNNGVKTKWYYWVELQDREGGGEFEGEGKDGKLEEKRM